MAYMDTTLANLPADGRFAATVADVTYFGNMQNEIYLTGLSGAKPALPMTAADLEDAAREQLLTEAFGYIAGSASTERTAAANLRAFDKHAIVPRMLRGTAAPDARDLSVEVFGTRFAAPMLTAPVGRARLGPRRRRGCGRSVTAEFGIGSILSTAASSTIEDVAAASGDNWWYQLYWPADDELARVVCPRAETAGAKAIVLTADTPGMGWRPRDLELGHLPFLQAQGYCQLSVGSGVPRKTGDTARGECRGPADRGAHVGVVVRQSRGAARGYREDFASGRHFRSR